jgi:hypothetical protein
MARSQHRRARAARGRASHAEEIDVQAIDGDVVIVTEGESLVLSAEAALSVAPALMAASRQALDQRKKAAAEDAVYFELYGEEFSG